MSALEPVPATGLPKAPPDDAPRHGVWAYIVSVLALFAAILTFLALMGVGLEPNDKIVLTLLGLDFALVLALVVIVARKIWRLRTAQKSGQAGARLHWRIVGLFALVAAVPTVLIASAAFITLERGLNPWFSGDLRALVQNAEVISGHFQQQSCQNLGREMRLMAADLDRANASGFFSANRQGFREFMTLRARALGFPVASILKADGSTIETADITLQRAIEPPDVLPDDFRFAATEEPPCLFSRQSIGGLIKLTYYGEEAFLFVVRPVDPRVLEFPVVARAGIIQYQVLEARRQASQYGIALVFALLTLIGLLAAILLALGFADRLIDPVRRLIQATDQVAAGNLYVQVPVAKAENDLGHLGMTFNNMTSVLREQHNSLTAANSLIDERRRFMEAVLSGVPAGVVGLDSNGFVTLANPMARDILGLGKRDIQGKPYAEILPEIAQFIDDARMGSHRLAQTEITVRRRGVERIVSVRATGEAGGGLVVTLDDISDLVTAQRSSAWSDVARRIAHEIKNPLTPIQLSAERIRRKFGKVIVEDRQIFDQCTDTIIRQVDDIKRMVDEFSSFARMPKPQPLDEDIGKTLREVVFMMRVAHPEIEFVETLPDQPVMVRFDRRLVSQAVQNLLKNASEAIAESPTGAAKTGRIEIILPAAEDEGVTIDIIDNGKGFPHENRQRLLEPYMTTRESGTGLGLPIVAKIFEDHGGRIELLDPPGLVTGQTGALVRIHLPRQTALETAETTKRNEG